MADYTCDVAVIGAGTAGLSAEHTARTAGAKTMLIDDKFAGTVCATVGCMPSKLLIAAAAAAHASRKADVFGVRTDVRVEGRAVMARLQAERDKFVAGTLAEIAELPDGVCFKSKARFTGPNQLVLASGETVDARAIVIATGAYPVVPKPFLDLGDLALTNRTVFEMADLPRSLAVIGGGPIGVEIAQAMARLGVETVLFDRAATLAGAKNEAIQSALQTELRTVMTLHLGVEVTAKRQGDQAKLTWAGADDAASGNQIFDRVLIAVGRPAQLGDLDLERSGLELDKHGTPKFDRATLQCGHAPVFIAGDANGDVPLLHEAVAEGAIAGRNAAQYPAVTPRPRHAGFALTFTDPPLAVLGEVSGDDCLVGCADYTDQGRAKVEARAIGLARIYASKPDGRLIGAELFAPGADHMAHLLALAIKRGETASSMLEMPFYHPTLEEGLKPALRAIRNASRGLAPQIKTETS